MILWGFIAKSRLEMALDFFFFFFLKTYCCCCMSECVCTCKNGNTLPAATSECFDSVYMRDHDTCDG